MKRIAPLLFAAAACGAAEQRAVEAPVAAASEPSPRALASEPKPIRPRESLAPFAGKWRVTGRTSRDGCSGRIYFASRSFVVDAQEGVIRSDFVDRVYPARIEGGTIHAEANLDAQGACPGTRIRERWEMTATPSKMEGTLESEWSLAPACTERCTVVFAIEAHRFEQQPIDVEED